MPAKRPTGARSETVRCEKCGEDYAVTYKRCPFCEDDEPTQIFRRPRVTDEPAPRRPAPREEPEMGDDEYEELFRRRPSAPEEPVRPARRQTPPEERPVRAERPTRRDEEDDYEEPPRRRARYEDDEEEDYAPPRRTRSKREDDYYDDEDDDDEEDYPPRRGHDGGKRLVTNARGGGYRHRGPSPLSIVGTVLTLVLIGAAIWIVYSIVTSISGKEPAPTPPVDTPTPSITVSVAPTPTTGDVPGDIVIPSDDPNSQPPSVGGEVTPPPVVTTIPSDQTATGFDLGKTEFTLSDTYPSYPFKVKFIPEGSTGSITWSSSKPNIVSVDQNGMTTAVAQGVATITATMAGGYSKQCMVRSTYGGTPAALPSTPATTSPAPSTSVAPSTSAAPSTPPSTGGKLALNVPLGLDGVVYDFSLKIGETWNLKVKNATGTPTWAIKDSSVASIDANGKVSGVAKGMTKVTATVDGQTLECIVRVS